MRSYREYRWILELWDQGCNKQHIAQVTGIPRTTVRDCIRRYGNLAGLDTLRRSDKILSIIKDAENSVAQSAYAYLLGLYLGDGHITHNNRVLRLRISLDKRYPGIITACVQALETLLPYNQVGVVECKSCVDVSCYHKHWSEIIPQHGAGPKHERKIELLECQNS